MIQSWRRLLFVHWRADPAQVQAALPQGLTVQTCDDSAWIGIVPFEMRRIRPYRRPALPWLSDFLELNVRTYVVDADGDPGVWFWSLNANRVAAVIGGRWLYALPYWWAHMSCRSDADGTIQYRCRRWQDREGRTSRFRYRTTGATNPASPSTLEYFLVERYALFSMTKRGMARAQVFHEPYPLQSVQLDAWDETPLAWDGLPQFGRAPDHVIWSPGVDVEVFEPRLLRVES
jgi:uncharacterized protein YqjF (DUF2071 family)